MFVRIQLLRMPGEERKFNRRRIVARIPTCRRARENAAQTSGSDGISTIGVGNVSATGGRVGEAVTVGVKVSGACAVSEAVRVSVVGTLAGEGVSVGAAEVAVSDAGVGVELNEV